MKDRLILLILLVLSWIILFIFQKYLPIQSAVYVLLILMSVYSFLMHAAQFHQKRKLKRKIELEELYQSQHKELKRMVYELESKIQSMRLFNTIFRVLGVIGLLIFLLKK